MMAQIARAARFASATVTSRSGLRASRALIRGSGAKFQDGLKAVCGEINLEIVKRSELHKFVVLPKRWIVERTIAWLNRCRRLAKDWECLNRNGLAFLRWASIRMMLRRLCQTTL
jgi:transposase